MVIVIGILSILSLVLMRFLAHGFSTYRINNQSIDSEEKAARVMRDFEYSTRAATKIETAVAQELVFYRFYDLSAIAPKKIRYFIDGNIFKVGVTEPIIDNSDVSYPSSNEVIDYLVENVSDLNFNYFDDAGLELSDTTNASLVKMIRLSITIDQDSGRPPAPVNQTTVVSLRNLKKNL